MASYEIRGKSIRGVVRVPPEIDQSGKITATFENTPAGMRAYQDWAQRMERQKELRQPAAAMTGITVRELLEAYEEPAGRTDSAKWNLLRLASFSEDPLCRKALAKVTTHDIDEWVQRRLARRNERTGEPISPSTVTRELNLLSGAFNWAVKTRRWIATNPCRGVDYTPLGAKTSRKPASLTMGQISAMEAAAGLEADPELQTLGARTCVAWLVALETGMRSGEILRVRPQHYWRDRCTVHVAAEERGGRKGSRSGTKDASRHVPLTARAIELWDWLLRTMPRGQTEASRKHALAECGMLKPPYIVGLTDGQRDANWRILARRAGLEGFTYHDAKHEACTRLAPHLDVLDLSHAIGTKDIALLRDTYYINDASRAAQKLPASLMGQM